MGRFVISYLLRDGFTETLEVVPFQFEGQSCKQFSWSLFSLDSFCSECAQVRQGQQTSLAREEVQGSQDIEKTSTLSLPEPFRVRDSSYEFRHPNTTKGVPRTNRDGEKYISERNIPSFLLLKILLLTA